MKKFTQVSNFRIKIQCTQVSRDSLAACMMTITTQSNKDVIQTVYVQTNERYRHIYYFNIGKLDLTEARYRRRRYILFGAK